jgi:uncharacterized hydrophobic protein (TIGR00271 family)
MLSRATVAGIVARVQHRAATALHVDETARSSTVESMLANNARRAPGYWIQLLLAIGIATLGLVLNSTAVIIGAMLVSPLMGPLVELGMGFAVGSLLLVMRASLRVMLSVAIAVSAAALITLALPFHEITAEVSARAAPTVLDLLVAMFCALTAAYTTVRPGSDTTAAAAGTAIGIALVPPLCAIGVGLGTRSVTVTTGAALLFTANFSAILVLSASSFLLLGFNQVDAATLELAFLDEHETGADRLTARLHRQFRQAFGSRYGVAMRVLVPILFLGAVFVPLKRALDEVTWEVRTRDSVRRILAQESPRAVQTQLMVERRTLTLRLLIVGTTARAVALEDLLIARLRATIGVTPAVTVVAVPNARSLLAEAAAAAPTRAAPPSPPPPADELRSQAGVALSEVWPAAVGPVVSWQLGLSRRDSTVLTIWHVGPALGAAGEALLGQAIAGRLRSPVTVHAAALPETPLAAPRVRLRAWRDSALAILTAVAGSDSAVACVRGPLSVRAGRATPARDVLAELRQSDAASAGRMAFEQADRLDIRVAVGSCGAPTR